MAGKGFSGQFGTALMGEEDATASTEIIEVGKWTFTPSTTVHKYNANTTGGHKRGVPGVKDSKCTIELKFASDVGPQVAPGDEMSLRLDVDDSGSNYFEINHAVIAGSPIECDIDDGGIVGTTYEVELSDYKGYGILAAYDSAPA